MTGGARIALAAALAAGIAVPAAAQQAETAGTRPVDGPSDRFPAAPARE